MQSVLGLLLFSLAAVDPAIGTPDPAVDCSGFTVTATNDGPVCPGQPGHLFATSNEANVGFHWYGSRMWERYGATVVATYPETYYVYATSATGCTASAETTLQVKYLESPYYTTTSPNCTGDPLIATLRDPGKFSNIVWSLDRGSIVRGQGTGSIEVLAEGAREVRITVDAVYSATGCPISWDSYVNNPPRFVVGLTASSSVCAGGTGTASVAEADDPDPRYAWEITNGVLVSLYTRTAEFTATGAGDVTLKVMVYKAGLDCRLYDTIVIPLTSATLTDPELFVCNGEAATIPVALHGKPPFSITWSDGVTQDGIVTNAITRTVSPSASSLYSLARVSDATCTGTVAGVTLVDVTSIPTIDVEPRDTTIRRGASTSLLVDGTGQNVRYDWYTSTEGAEWTLVASGPSNQYSTPPLDTTTSYQVSAVNPCGTTLSRTAVITVANPRRRAARH